VAQAALGSAGLRRHQLTIEAADVDISAKIAGRIRETW
jgi:hypothetical protein